MLYQAQPVVIMYLPKNKIRSSEIPIFYLDSHVQGIVNIEGAKQLVRDICNPFDDPNIEVNENVSIAEIFD